MLLLEQNMNNMTPMIRTIVIQYGDFMKEIIRALPAALTAAQGGQTLTGNISTVGKEFADILKSLIPSLPEASATLVTNNPNPPPPPPDSSLDTNFGGSEIITSQNQIEFNKRQAEAQAEAERKRLAAIPSTKTLSAASDKEYLAWITKLGALKATYQNLTNVMKPLRSRTDSRGIQQFNSVKSKRYDVVVQIRRMSRDGRHPNNNIRENSNRLRQAMANGQWLSNT